jgi:hypothetical protein
MAAVATNASRKKLSVDFLKCTPAVGTGAAFTLQGIGTSRLAARNGSLHDLPLAARSGRLVQYAPKANNSSPCASSSTSSAWTNQRQSDNRPRWIAASFCPDIGCSDHLGPFIRFIDDEVGELSG